MAENDYKDDNEEENQEKDISEEDSDAEDLGDPEVVAEEPTGEQESLGRVRTPRGREVLGLVDSRLGAGKSRVICSDKKVRVCRVPGRYRRRIWANPGDIVIVEPWEYEGDKKGDVIFKYRRVQIDWLRKKGMLDNLDVA